MNPSDYLIIDNFAGGGGASTGIEFALGRSVDIAINHCAQAVAMHKANHPGARHLCEDVFSVDPVAVCAGRRVGLAWFSPDCKHFSKAKGGKPRSKKIRGLAWVMVKWCATVRPLVCVLENVEEFQTWGPLLADGNPCPQRKGRTFKSFIKRLQNLGYAVEWRELRACDYGAPTIRKRLFLIARCDGHPIVWPEPTHAAPSSPEVASGRLQPWRTAAECIDWSLPCHSIFLSTEEGRRVGVNRPLAESTMRRIARGLKKFVLDAKSPFIVPLTHQGGDRVEGVTEPFRTTTGAHRGERAVVVPSVAPFLTEHANASTQRVFAPGDPMRTQCAEVKGGHFALVAAHLSKYYGERRQAEAGRGSDPNTPLHTQPTENRFAVIAAFMAKHFGGHETPGAPVGAPLPTVTTVDHNAVVSAHLTVQTTGHPGSPVLSPHPTICTGGHQALIQATFLSKLYGTSTGAQAAEPMHTVTSSGNHMAEVRAFFVKYYGNEASAASACGVPLHTVTTKERMGLVTIQGQDYAITDICMRMLEPRELFSGQGFPSHYIIAPIWKGKPLTKKAQVRMCGNSVCPPLAAAIVAANVPELRLQTQAA